MNFRKKNRQLLALLLAVVCCVSLLAACGGAASSVPAAVETASVVSKTEEPAAAAETPAAEVSEEPQAQPSEAPPAESDAGTDDAQTTLDEHGSYTTKEDVSLFLVTYGHLPDNFITKKEAKALGWPGGSLEPYAPGCCIGGDYFGNNEGLLPAKAGREYHECDIDTLGAEKRGAKRIIYSNDGLIYYTDDHYDSFTLLYGEE